MPASHDPGEVGRIAGLLREGITTGVIPPGEPFSSWRIRCLMCLDGSAIRSAGAALRREGIVFCHDREHYTAPAGSPQPTVSARLGRALAEVRGSLGISVPGLAALIADNRGPWGPGGWEHMVVLRMADITAIEAGTWKPRWVWEYIDTALNAGGTLLRIHDNLYAHQTVQASGKRLHGPERRHHRTEGCCAGKPACASGPAIAALTPDIAAVHARFHRSTVNIGVVGQVAAGKSMLLRTTTGLGEVVIPSGGLKSTTAVRSRILHSPGRADAQVLLRTWEGFRDGYLQPLHDDAGLMDGTVPITPCTMSGSTASSRSAGWRTLSSWTCPARARPR